MKRNNISVIASLLLLCLDMSGCGKELLTGEAYPDVNLFAPDEADHSANAELRRSFYNQTGSYLLFSDTLRRADRIRVLSIPYNVTITGRDYYEAQLYRLKYLTNSSQRTQAAEFIRTRMAKFVSKQAMPYSVLLVDTIVAYPYEKSLKTYNMEKPDVRQITVFGMQTLAIARMGDLAKKSPKEQKTLAVEILNNLVKEVMRHTDEDTLASYYAISAAYYDKAFSKEEGNLPDIKDMRELGFLKCYRFKPDNMSFYPASRDLETFVKELLGKSEAQWRSEHGAYPLVIRKLEILKSVIEKKGISLSYLAE